MVTRVPLNMVGEPINVLARGVVGDGSDEGTELQAALDAAIAGQVVVFPATATGYYATSIPLTCPANVGIRMEQPIRYTGTSDVAILTIGEQQDITFRQDYRIGVQRATRNWSSDDAIGIKMINQQYCHIDVFDCRDNTIGCLFTGDATGISPSNQARGWAYNEVWFRFVLDNKYSVVLESKGGSGAFVGYINENSYYGGNFVCNSGTETTTSRYGVVVRSADGAYTNNNNNVFFKPCFQLGEPTGGAESVGFVVEEGVRNYVVKGRFEANDYIARFSGVSARNHVDCGYSDTEDYEQLESAVENFVINTELKPAPQAMTLELFSEHDLARACRGVSGTSVMIEGLSWGISSSATRTAYSGSGVTYTAEEVTIPGTRAIGVYIDTTEAKEFVVRRSGSAGGRVGVTAYDSGGSILSGSGIVMSPSDNALSASADFGGCYRTGTDNLRPIAFRVGPTVDYVWLFVTGGTGDAELSGLSISTLPQYTNTRVYPGFQTAFLEGSATFNPGSLADGAGESTTVTVTGAAIGDYAEASFGVSTQGITVTASVTAADTVTVRFQNETGGALDLASSTLRARVHKHHTPA